MAEEEDVIRAEINALVARTGLTPYGVWLLLDKRLARSSVNKYLVGNQDLTGRYLSMMLVALRQKADEEN